MNKIKIRRLARPISRPSRRFSEARKSFLGKIKNRNRPTASNAVFSVAAVIAILSAVAKFISLWWLVILFAGIAIGVVWALGSRKRLISAIETCIGIAGMQAIVLRNPGPSLVPIPQLISGMGYAVFIGMSLYRVFERAPDGADHQLRADSLDAIDKPANHGPSQAAA